MIFSQLGDALRKQLRTGRLAGAALTLTSLGLQQRLRAAVPKLLEVQVDIGERIAPDTIDPGNLAFALWPEGKTEGVTESIGNDETDDHPPPIELPALADSF